MKSVYYKLREHLDTMPNGFPASESGVEIEILKKIFTEEEASLFINLKLKLETPQQISERTGIKLEVVERLLPEMKKKGQLLGITVKKFSLYKAIPYVFGIYEFQLKRMDKDMALLFEKYDKEAFAENFFSTSPALMKTIPIGIEVNDDTRIEPYESITGILEGAKSWAVRGCVCKTEKSLLGRKCSKPMEVCLSFAPVENAFDDDQSGRAITKDEAYKILKMSEEAGLVHMTSNVKSGHYYICNCCSCCCGPLTKYITVSKNAAAKSNYQAIVDKYACISCGICLDRCQADAIELNDFAIITNCIGCGLCVSTCPSGAIKLVRRDSSDSLPVPSDEREWMEMRVKERGIGDGYKKML